MDNKPQKINCHFISNTHWDREWRFSARRTQYMLGYMLDMLTDILDKYPEYRHFHLDSQTMPIQDYLEAYPEKKELMKNTYPRVESVSVLGSASPMNSLSAANRLSVTSCSATESARKWAA